MSASIFSTLNPGNQVSFAVEITEELSQCFANLSATAKIGNGDPILDESMDQKQNNHHLLVISMIANWLYQIIPNRNSQCVNIHYEFLSQINRNDHIDTVIELLEADEEKHLVTLRINCFNHAKMQVITGQAVMLVQN